MHAEKHRLKAAVFLFCISITTCATASRAADTEATDKVTPSSNADASSFAPYIVQQGDCLGKILRTVFQLPEEVIFSPQTTMSIQKANPHIHNLNDLQAGEKLLIPSAIRRLSPDKNMISPEVTQPGQPVQKRADTSMHPLQNKQSGGTRTVGSLHANPPSDEQSGQGLDIATDETPIKEDSLDAADTLDHEKKIRSMLIDFVKAFDGYDNTSCTKTLPIENGGTIAMDCSKFPVYEFPWGARIIMDYGNHLPEPLRKIISAQWAHTEIITADSNDTAETLFSRVIDACGLLKNDSGNRYTVSHDNIQISASGTWIVYKDHAQKKIFIITITNDPCLSAPGSLQEYLEGLGVKLLQLSTEEKKPCMRTNPVDTEYEIMRLQTDPVYLTDMILELLGINAQKNVKTKITPLNARGITFEVTIDRKFQSAGKTCFIDFKNLSSNIASMISHNGNKILQLDAKTENYMNLIQEILVFCAMKNFSSPAQLKFDQSEKSSLEISIPGFLLHTKNGDFLLTNININKYIALFLSESGVKIIKF